MSLLQNPEFAIYQLRTSYLSSIQDGVGDRLIAVNPAVFNTPGFRAAGWRPNPADIRRTYSPPIPTAVASEYFHAPPRSAGIPPSGFVDDDEEGGMATGVGGSGDTLGPGLTAKRRRRREQMEEEDSSDLSDESDEDGERAQRAAQQIKFAKMPVRTRSGSSPIRGSNVKDGPSVMITSPSRRSEDSRLRRGSLGAVEAVKARARRDTTTSSEMSSENELDPSVFQRKDIQGAGANRVPPTQSNERQNTKESTDLEDDDSGEESGTTLSSEFAETEDSPSLLDSVDGPSTSSPFSHIRVASTPQAVSPKKSRQAQPLLQALPPPRPISTIQPVSALSLAINAKRSKVASPFEGFATLFGKGDPSPLHLKIYAPFSKRPTSPYEVPIRRIMRDDNNLERKVTVADCIGLSLWRYAEENIMPQVAGEKMNVNRWTLRMVEDEEVDFDFPALDRTKPMNDFTSNNNRAARARSTSKAYDEFALVEATEQQFRENERLTPKFAQEDPPAEGPDELVPQPNSALNPTPMSGPAQRRNPLLGPSFNAPSAIRMNLTQPADMPSAPPSHATPRTGASKILRVHLISPGGYTQLVAVDVTTDTYLAEVLTIVCKKRNIDKAHHILKVSNTNVVAPLDRTVESLGDRGDIDLVPRRFGNDGPMILSGSPGSTPPNAPLLVAEGRKFKKGPTQMLHPLAQKQDVLGSSANYKKYTIWRKQPMSFMPTHERILGIDGEYLHVMPGETGKSTIFDSGAKTNTIHFSNIIGCKSSRKHPSNFRVVVFRERESKRYDFEAQNPVEAAEIVAEIKKGIAPFQNSNV